MLSIRFYEESKESCFNIFKVFYFVSCFVILATFQAAGRASPKAERPNNSQSGFLFYASVFTCLSSSKGV